MRHSVLATIAATCILVVACSEQPTAPRETQSPSAEPSGPSLVSSAICSTPTATCIQRLINALFRPGDQLKTANTHWSNIQTKVRQNRPGEAQAKATDLVTFGLKSFYAGKLLGGMSQQTRDNLAALVTAVYQYAGATNAPVLPPEALDPDGAAAIITPQSPTTLVLTGTKQAGVIVPAGAAPVLTLVTIARLPDSPGPLLTSLDQFPLFYEFTSSPEVTFNTDVTTGVCQLQDFDAETYQRLRLAHNVGTDFGDVEILPRVNAPFLDCTNTTQVGALQLDGLSGLAANGWNVLGRTIGPLAKAVFLPDELHAAVLGTCCLGGTNRKFSPHGAVDPESNPGSLSIVDENGDPASGDVSGPGTIRVKTASSNGEPIQNVPVSFGETTVLTNANGIASFVWSATPGTSLTASVPNEENEIGVSCPDGIPEPAPNTAYRPLVCFTPSSVTFTAFAVTPGSSSLQLIASSNAGGVIVEDTDAASQEATLNQLSATVSASAVNEAMSVLTEGSAVATWQSGAAGQIVFTDFGWTTVGVDNPISHAHLETGTDWTYTFTPNQSGTFSLDYDITLDPATTNDFGLNGFRFWWAEGAGEPQLEKVFCVDPSETFNSCEPTTTGTITKSVVAGTTYTVRLENHANIFGALGSRTAYMSGTFDWSVTPTPPVILSRSARSPSAVTAPRATAQLLCVGTQRRVCTRTYQANNPATAP